MATPSIIVRACISTSQECAFRLFISQIYNFRGSPVNRENWLPQKFLAIRYCQQTRYMLSQEHQYTFQEGDDLALIWPAGPLSPSSDYYFDHQTQRNWGGERELAPHLIVRWKFICPSVCLCVQFGWLSMCAKITHALCSFTPLCQLFAHAQMIRVKGDWELRKKGQERGYRIQY